MKHIGWIIILLGALVMALTGCDSKPERPIVKVKCFTMYDGSNMYLITSEKENGDDYKSIDEYYASTNITNGMFIRDRSAAIALATHFNTFEKIKHWNDSVHALIKPVIKPEPDKDKCNEVITIY